MDAQSRRAHNFDGTEAPTWPFPETTGSPVWLAWRQRQVAERAEVAPLATFWRDAGVEQLLPPRSKARSTDGSVAAADACAVPTKEKLREANSRIRAVRASENALRPTRGTSRDRLERFFDPNLAVKLCSAGLATLGAVAEADSSGHRWWSSVAGIGPKRAKEIAARVHALLRDSTDADGGAAEPVAKRAAQWFPG